MKMEILLLKVAKATGLSVEGVRLALRVAETYNEMLRTQHLN